MPRFAYPLAIATALTLTLPAAGFGQTRSVNQGRVIPIGDLAVAETVVTLDTTVRCTSGGKPVKCPAKILVLND